MAVHDDSAGLASSLTDLMTSLAVIFILLLVASLNNTQQEIDTVRQDIEDTRRKLEAAEQRTETTRHAMLVTLKKALEVFAIQGVKAEADPTDPLGLLVLVPEGLLDFAVGRDQIPPAGREFLRAFTPKLASTACSSQFQDDINAIVVEGHTDSSGTDATNLPLSQARSMAVVRDSLLILSEGDEGGGSASGLRGCFLHLLSASGRGSSEPILDREGKEDKARSRRVVFKIRLRSLEQRGVQEELGAAALTPPPRTMP
jgi:outer membrane protein OmpA-like peptidoglycan-associated protein